jgi:hypothetical protein
MYTLRISEPESGKRKEIQGVMATTENKETLTVDVS